MISRKKISFTILISIMFPVLALAACKHAGSYSQGGISETGFYLDTVVTLTVYGTEDKSILQGAFSLIADYESMLSRTREGSDIWNINHSAGTPTEVSAETISLLQTALNYCELSDGAFDITIAPVTDLWDFHGEGSGNVPDQEQLAEALSHVNYKNIKITGNTVTLSDAQAAIDLGAIAKGYIGDRIKDFLLSKGIASGMVNLGGNVLVIGEKPDSSLWKIGIRKPFSEDGSELSAVVSAADQSVVTSGTYERYFIKDNILYHHILDPKTGYPAQTGLSSVSILSDSSTEGDALSTTCFLLGPEKGMNLIEKTNGVEALFITEDGELLYSSGFSTT